jgi:hypothetical protein
VIEEHHSDDGRQRDDRPHESAAAGAERLALGAAGTAPRRRVTGSRGQRRDAAGQRRDRPTATGRPAVGLPGGRSLGDRDGGNGWPFGLADRSAAGGNRWKAGSPCRLRLRGRTADRCGLLLPAGCAAAADRAPLTGEDLLHGHRFGRRAIGVLSVPGPTGRLSGDATGDTGSPRAVPRRLFPHRCRHLLVVVRTPFVPCTDDTGGSAAGPPDARHRWPPTTCGSGATE